MALPVDKASAGEQEPGKLKIYLLPNLLTAGNLFCGFLALTRIVEADIQSPNFSTVIRQALLFILLACIFDLFDGRVARMGGRESPFGREFDSLADIISFGAAPAFLVHRIVLKDVFVDHPEIGWFLASIYLICGALRLARFNCLTSQPNGGGVNEFLGFPIPAAAGLVASLTWFLLWWGSADSWLLSPRDLKDLPSFASRLKQQSDPVSQFLMSRLSEATRQKVSTFVGTPEEDEKLRQALVEELNRVEQGDSIYQEQRFSGVSLSPTTQALLENDTKSERLIRLNRLLLEDAYRPEIARSRFALGKSLYVLPILMVFLSVMMVSEVRYPSFKKLDLRTRRTFTKMVITILVIGFFLITWRKILPVVSPVIFTAYLIYGFIRPRLSRRIVREIEDEEEEEEP